MAQARKADDDGKPVPILLYLPSVVHKLDEGGRVTDVGHGRCVGWWSDHQESWVTALHPTDQVRAVYPSLWTELPAGPDL